MSFWQQLCTVIIFTKLNTRRFFRDRLALFFGILFPLIFLLVFGGLNSGSNQPTFRVVVLNQSETAVAQRFTQSLESNSTFKVDSTVRDRAAAEEKLTRGQLDGIIILPEDFGAQRADQPTGTIRVVYTQSGSGAGQTLTSVLESTVEELNAGIATESEPFSVAAEELNRRSLRTFDYVFAGLLGFSIIGLGIFGPVNVFPELKKLGILRRLRTTPLRVWQYFLSTMFSQALIAIVAVAIQFAVAFALYDLKVIGNFAEIALFVVISTFMILGIGLAIGGWAQNERQAAPLSNLIVFPMLFLSGTFFPRFAMPEWLQRVSEFLPLTPVIDGLRLLITEGRHLWEIGPQLGLIAAWFVVIYAIAFRVFRWE